LDLIPNLITLHNHPMEKTKRTRKVHHKPWYMYLVLCPLFVIYRLWESTIRIQIVDEDAQKLTSLRSPQVIVFWHNVLFVAPLIQRRIRKKHPIYAMISASKDGAWLEALFNLLGMRSIRGSANFRGAQSLKDMIRVSRQGHDIGITPDGSKGPPYVLKPGAAAVAKACKCAVTLFGVEFSSAWRLNSWDGFFLPKPFSTVSIRVDAIDSYAELGESDPLAAAKVMERRLLKLHPFDSKVGSQKSDDS